MDDSGRVRSALGFAMKAGKVRSGAFASEQAVKTGKASLTVLDSDSSENTKTRWTEICNNAGVPLVFAEDVGKAIGKENVMVACIVDSGFASMIMRYRDENVM